MTPALIAEQRVRCGQKAAELKRRMKLWKDRRAQLDAHAAAGNNNAQPLLGCNMFRNDGGEVSHS